MNDEQPGLFRRMTTNERYNAARQLILSIEDLREAIEEVHNVVDDFETLLDSLFLGIRHRPTQWSMFEQ